MDAAHLVQPVLFVIIFFTAGFLFYRKAKEVYVNINMGKPEQIHSDFSYRLKQMILIALGQKKMFKRPIAAIMHLFIYVAFLFTQIELIEIIIDGIFGQHRAVWHFLEGTYFSALYLMLISFVELLSVGAFIATIVFLSRRNLLKLPRFNMPELIGFPFKDANAILIMEIALIFFLMLANSTDLVLQYNGVEHYTATGPFLISQYIAPLFYTLPMGTLIVLERIGWWGHILVVLSFLLYLPYSKHLHILLAFPNTYFSRPEPHGKMSNMPAIMNEVKSMMDPSATSENDGAEMSFGANDVNQLSWKSLLEAYTCTECGRCTANCPANLTGKKLSPRKIMMDTRDRMEELGKLRKVHGADFKDNKKLLGDYITKEELRACTTCNACVEECPVNISPLNIILELRRSMIMEEADSPAEWNNVFSNLENNQAPWQFSPEDRANWVHELN